MRDDAFTRPPAIAEQPALTARQEANEDAPPPPRRDIRHSARGDVWFYHLAPILLGFFSIGICVIVPLFGMLLSGPNANVGWGDIAGVMLVVFLLGGVLALVFCPLHLLICACLPSQVDRAEEERICAAASRYPPR